MTSEVETTCTSTYDDERIKGALHIGMLALLAATWEHYGHRCGHPSPSGCGLLI